MMRGPKFHNKRQFQKGNFRAHVQQIERGSNTITVRNKNVMYELLKSPVEFARITIAERLKTDSLTDKILELARSKHIPVEEIPYKNMAMGRSGESHEVIVAYIVIKTDWSFEDMMQYARDQRRVPFILILNKVGYANNLGAIARTAFAAGVTGIIYHGDADQIFSEETIHFSLGTLARIPLVRMSTFEALKELKKEGIRTYSLQMGGTLYTEENLKGAVGIVLGNEGEGISDTVSDKCDKKISIPMMPGIDSLNVSASGAVIMYEKVRQEGKGYLKME